MMHAPKNCTYAFSNYFISEFTSESSIDDRLKATEDFNGFFKDIYVKPYCRIPPYVMGIVLGYVLFKHFSKEFKLPVVRRKSL